MIQSAEKIGWLSVAMEYVGMYPQTTQHGQVVSVGFFESGDGNSERSIADDRWFRCATTGIFVRAYESDD